MSMLRSLSFSAPKRFIDISACASSISTSSSLDPYSYAPPTGLMSSKSSQSTRSITLTISPLDSLVSKLLVVGVLTRPLLMLALRHTSLSALIYSIVGLLIEL